MGFLHFLVGFSGGGLAGSSAWLGILPSVFFERRKPKDDLPRPVAHIALGQACLQLGDLREARTQLELGLSRFEELGSGLRERFGLDVGAIARAFSRAYDVAVRRSSART